MIAQLSGTLIHKQPNTAIIDVNGVGYDVTISLPTFYEIGDVGSPVTLKIHTHVREDSLQLFGFRAAAEKDLFQRLTSVSGIGPRLAITMLSGMAYQELIPAILNNDLARLTGIPGVGRKTAERVVIELRDKLGSISRLESETDRAEASQPARGGPQTRDDAISALVALGYQKPVAERAVLGAMNESGDSSIEAVLKRALKRLSR